MSLQLPGLVIFLQAAREQVSSRMDASFPAEVNAQRSAEPQVHGEPAR